MLAKIYPVSIDWPEFIWSGLRIGEIWFSDLTVISLKYILKLGRWLAGEFNLSLNFIYVTDKEYHVFFYVCNWKCSEMFLVLIWMHWTIRFWPSKPLISDPGEMLNDETMMMIRILRSPHPCNVWYSTYSQIASFYAKVLKAFYTILVQVSS